MNLPRRQYKVLIPSRPDADRMVYFGTNRRAAVACLRIERAISMGAPYGPDVVLVTRLASDWCEMTLPDLTSEL